MPYLCRYSLPILKKGTVWQLAPVIYHNMAFEMTNISIAQNELPQIWPSNHPQSQSYLLASLMSLSFWQYAVTFIIAILAYDQGKENFQHDKNVLMPSLVMYIKRKGSIAGPPLKIPLMGPFIQALHPKFEGYLAQWASGPLSCVSVFHK